MPPRSIYEAALGASYARGIDYFDFLAARFATLTGDPLTASHYFRRAALSAPEDPARLDRAVVSALLALQTYEARELAAQAPRTTLKAAPFARLLLAASDAGRGQRKDALAALDGAEFGPVSEDVARILREELSRPARARRSTIDLADQVFRATDAAAAQSGREQRIVFALLALAIDPDASPARFALADALAELERAPEAVLVLNELESADPLYPTAVVRMAELEAGQKRSDEAAGLLRRIDWGAQPGDLPLRAADVFRKAGRLAEAEDLYTRVLAAGGDANGRALLARANVRQRMGRLEAAEGDLLEARRIAPNEPSVLVALATAWIDRDSQLDEALGLLQTAASLRPEDPDVLHALGRVQARLGDDVAAAGYLERAAERAPTRPDVLERLGDVYWRLGRPREAGYEWRRALAFGLEASQGERILAKLAGKLPETDSILAAQADPVAASHPNRDPAVAQPAP